MNKNDKFHGAEFDVNAQAISDEELDDVSGGTTDVEYKVCPYCGALVKEFYFSHRNGRCASGVQNS